MEGRQEHDRPGPAGPGPLDGRARQGPEGGMIRLETLIELKFASLNFRAYYLIEIRQAVPCRAIRGDTISVNGTLPPPSQRTPGRERHAH